MLRKLTILATLLLLANLLFGQSERSIQLYSYRSSLCDNTDNNYRIQNRISEIMWNADTCTIELSVLANCCGVDDAKVTLQHDTLFLAVKSETIEVDEKNDTTWIEESCMCHCHFILTFKIGNLNKLK